MQHKVNEFVNFDKSNGSQPDWRLKRWVRDNVQTVSSLPIYILCKGSRCEVERTLEDRIKSGGSKVEAEVDKLLYFAEHIVDHDISSFGSKFERYTPQHRHHAIPSGMDAFKVSWRNPEFRLLLLRATINGEDCLIICSAGRNHDTGKRKQTQKGPMNIYDTFGAAVIQLTESQLIAAP